MNEYLIGIDAGNTSCKVVIFDKNGDIVANEGTPSMHFKKRRRDFEEFDVDELWTLLYMVIKKTIENAEIDPAQIKGIGVTSFGNGAVLLGKNGENIAPGCFSQDHRADGILEMYKKTGVYDKLNDKVKGTIFAGEPGPIMRWYKENEPDVYDQIGGILLFKDYIMYKLTGEFATDLNCCGGSFLVDMDTMDYSKELLELYGVEDKFDYLPKLASEPTEVIGHVSKEASILTGLAEGTPVVAGMMDILACLVGAGATGDGVYTAIAGSWCINETHSTRIIPNASSNMPYLRKGEYLNCSYTGASGSNYEWFHQTLGSKAKREAEDRGISMFDVLDEYISSVKPEDASVFFCPFVAQPSIHPNAKANFINIDSSTTYADMAYAVAEGVAFIHKHHVDFLKRADLPLETIRLTGGVARSRTWNQIFANVLRVPIIGVDCEETGALGSAIAAGIGVGVFDSYEDAFSKAVKTKDPIYPDESTFEFYDKRYAEWQRINECMMRYWEG